MSLISAGIDGFEPAPAGWLARVMVRLQCYWRLHQESAQLLAMDDRDLHDIGISRVDAIREAGRSAWGGCRQASKRRTQP